MAVSTRRWIHAVILGMATTAAVGVAGTAHAATGTTVTKVGNELVVTAAAGRANDISVRRAPNPQFILVTDRGDALVAGAGCTVGGLDATCSAIGISRIVVNAGDGNDRVVVDFNNPSTINGGTGNDILSGVNIVGDDTINGGDGNDNMFGNGGFDRMFGQAGNDVINGGGDSDGMSGGTGNDTMFGGAGNDVLNGNAGIDTLNGGSGFDDLCIGESVVNCEA